MRYPLEVEFTNFCSLKCKVCINRYFQERWNISLKFFQLIIDYIFQNKEKILYINFAWIGDIFMHPQITQFIEIFIEKFRWSGINILVPTKGQQINLKHIFLLKKLKESGIEVNINVWFYSFLENIQDKIAWWKSFFKMIYFLKLLKKFCIPFSIELISDDSEDLIRIKKYASYFWCWYSIQNIHNFVWLIKWEKFGSNKCSFNEGNNYNIKDSFCSFIPFINFSWYIYPCSISSGKKEFSIWNIQKLFQDFPNYVDLVNYIKDNIVEEKCIQCSLYKNYEKKYIIWNNNNQSV